VITHHVFVQFYRDANLSEEGFNCYTPLLTAAAHKQTKAFHCLMQYADLSSNTENPAFKVLSIPNYNSDILQVKHWRTILYVQYFLKPNNLLTSIISLQTIRFYPSNIQTLTLQFLLDDCIYGERLCHTTNNTRHTPLHIASEHGNLEAVKILLGHGASDNAQNRDFQTPMHLAAGKGLEQ